MKAFRATPHFEPYVKTGKRAVKAEHRPRLIESDSARVLSSISFEDAVAHLHDSRKRWDYFIEVTGAANRMHAVEVHAFEPTVLRAKKQGTLAILRERCPAAEDTIDSWRVIVRGSLPRSDLIARFRADTRIDVDRSIRIAGL